MSSCEKCNMRDGDKCLAYEKNKLDFARPISPPPMGACMQPIVADYIKQILPGMKVLEIGCGTWSPIKNHCKTIGAQYEAIDVQDQYYGKPVVATKIENLSELSFEDNFFDLVVGNQSLEHWAEHGCTNAWGLYQCFRVCKLNGMVLLNVPIHFHGTKLFVHGDLEGIAKLFSKFSKSTRFEKWGSPSTPIQSICYFEDFAPLRDKPGYHLNILSKKDLPTKCPPMKNYLGFHGPLAQILNYSLSFNLYRLKKKILAFLS